MPLFWFGGPSVRLGVGGFTNKPIKCVILGKKKSFLSECFIFPQSEEPQMEVL